MKVLFADSTSLNRYGITLLAKQCSTTLEVLEAESLQEVISILATEDISILFLHVSILEKKVIKNIQKVKNSQEQLQIILVSKNKFDHVAKMSFIDLFDGILYLEDTVENTRDHIENFLNDNLSTHKQKSSIRSYALT